MNPAISLIVCSRTPSIPDNLLANVAETIGDVPYEWVCIDNSQNQYSIFQAYNLGVSRAKGEVLCFMHDDIFYRSNHWGSAVVKMLAVDADACATMTNKYVRRAPSYTGNVGYGHLNYIDEVHGIIREKHEVPTQVILFDGMWFCIRRKCFDKIRFDEQYSGFHFYDMDIAMQLYTNGYRTMFIPDILIWHRTGAQYNRVWLENSYRFYDKWHTLLPLTVNMSPPSHATAYSFELQAVYTSLRLIVRHRCWHLLPRYAKMVVQTLHLPVLIGTLLAFIHHFTIKPIKNALQKCRNSAKMHFRSAIS